MSAFSSLILTGVLLLVLANSANAVQCYVCSWNPRDLENDTCTTRNFNPHRVRTHDCKEGCETVTMRDINGDLEMFYRNCYTTQPDGGYIYSKENTRVNEEEVHKCYSRLCNASNMTEPSHSILLFVSIICFFLLHRL